MSLWYFFKFTGDQNKAPYSLHIAVTNKGPVGNPSNLALSVQDVTEEEKQLFEASSKLEQVQFAMQRFLRSRDFDHNDPDIKSVSARMIGYLIQEDTFTP